jgi:hypothetical protein
MAGFQTSTEGLASELRGFLEAEQTRFHFNEAQGPSVWITNLIELVSPIVICGRKTCHRGSQ